VDHDFVRKATTGIQLHRMKTSEASTASSLPERTPLCDDPCGRKIADWLKASLPHVRAVRVEELVVKARQFQKIDRQAFAAGSVFNTLPPTLQKYLCGLHEQLHTTMDDVAKVAASPTRVLANTADEETIQKLIRNIYCR
jgi:hypothetical protein